MKKPKISQEDANVLLNENVVLRNALEKAERSLAESQAEIKSLQENLKDISGVHSNVMDEKCWPDEKHCTCVPFLRVGIAELRDAVAVIAIDKHSKS